MKVLIKELLDRVNFAESDTWLTDRNFSGVWKCWGRRLATSTLREVKSELEEQVKIPQEQKIINSYLAELKADAEIEIL